MVRACSDMLQSIYGQAAFTGASLLEYLRDADVRNTVVFTDLQQQEKNAEFVPRLFVVGSRNKGVHDGLDFSESALVDEDFRAALGRQLEVEFYNSVCVWRGLTLFAQSSRPPNYTGTLAHPRQEPFKLHGTSK
ncbi:hypothetical protein CBL_02615 [Carabus blaptoides fortunei]